MKRIRKLATLLLAICMTLSLTGCNSTAASNSESAAGSAEVPENTEEIIINEKLMNVSGNTAETMAEDFFGGDSVEVTRINDDGTISVFMTAEEREILKNKEESNLESLNEEMQAQNPDYRLEWNDTHDSFALYFSQDLDEIYPTAWFLAAETYCALYQLLDQSGTDWYVRLSLYNSESGLLVAQGDSNSVFSYNDDDWAASYSADWKKALPENTVYIDFNAEVLSYFGQTRSSMKGFLESYSDYYLQVVSTPEALSMAVGPDCMEDFIAFNLQLMEEEQEYFSSLYDGYEMIFSEDGTSVVLRYDAQIEDSDMTTEAVECFLLAVMDQVLRAQDGSAWTLHVEIYNCNTGEQTENETIPGEDLYITSRSGWN